MNDSQRNLVFWLLLVAAPFVFFVVGNSVSGNAEVARPEFGLLAAILGAIACIGGAFYVRSRRSNE